MTEVALETQVVTLIAALAVIVASVVVIVMAAKVGRAADEVHRIVGEELGPLVSDFGQTVRNMDAATTEARSGIARFDRVVKIIEELVGGAAMAAVASRAVGVSSGALRGVIEGVRTGLKVLRSVPKQTKGVSEDDG